MRAIVWNAEERRLRAGVRFVLHTVVLVGMTFGWVKAAARSGSWEDPLVSVGLIVTPIASVLLAARFLDRRRLQTLGLRVDRWFFIDAGAGFAIGTVLMAIVFAIGWSMGWVRVQGIADVWVLSAVAGLAMGTANAFSEELWFRGYYMTNFAEGGSRLGARRANALAIALSSIIFGLAHAQNPNATPLAVIGLVAVGVLFALCYTTTEQLGLSLGLHTAWNFVQSSVFPLCVSGRDPQPPLIEGRVVGPPLWMGGSFGPEAGLLVFVAVAVGCALVLLYARLRSSRARAASGSADAS